MRFVFHIVLTLSILALTSSNALAQVVRLEDLAKRNYLAETRKIMNEEWSERLPDGVDFMVLRRTYSNTDFYNPLSNDATKWLLDIAKQALETKDPNKKEQLIKKYNIIRRDHVANYDVITAAWELARQDPMFGNHKFLNAIRRALFHSILRSGDGLSTKGAYDVITAEEEILLMKYLGFKVLDTIGHKEGFFFFNIHSVIDTETKQHYEIFVNTTVPMQYMEKVAAEQQPELNIQKR